MITLTTEQAQQIEVALKYARNVCISSNWSTDDTDEALSAIRAARAQEQAEQEPVAWYGKSKTGNILLSVNCVDEDWQPLYAAPVRTKDLTDDEIERALDAAKVPELPDGYKSVDLEIARAVIAADREKNK